MNKKSLQDKVEIPEGVDISMDRETLKVKGPKGEVTRRVRERRISFRKEKNEEVITTSSATKREKTLLGTYKSHLKNMIKGCTEGHTYILKVCSGHFPMNVSVSGSEFIVKNYLGEKVPRKLKIKTGAEVKVEGEKVIVEGIDKEIVSQTAAGIEQLTRRCGFDKRIFQDGIFITNKDGKEIK